MQAGNEHAVKVLNGLIERTLDSVNGYREAAEHVDNPTYKSMFAERVDKRLALTRQLQAEVRTFGAEPEDDQSFMGKAHNKFVGLKDAVTGSSDKGVINEVERGEDVLKAQFESAVGDSDLPPQVQNLVSRLYQEVKADHDQISRIKHELH